MRGQRLDYVCVLIFEINEVPKNPIDTLSYIHIIIMRKTKLIIVLKHVSASGYIYNHLGLHSW